VVHGLFLYPSSKRGGWQLDRVEVLFVGGWLVLGGQGWGLTLDVTGHVWMLGDRRSPQRFDFLGCGGGSPAGRRCHGALP